MDAHADPDWLTEPCPDWCDREHAHDDHPEDRYHQSRPSIISALAGTGGTIPVADSLRPVELAVRLGRHVDDDVAWVAIEPLEAVRPRLVLSEESARVLAQELCRQLDARR